MCSLLSIQSINEWIRSATRPKQSSIKCLLHLTKSVVQEHVTEYNSRHTGQRVEAMPNEHVVNTPQNKVDHDDDQEDGANHVKGEFHSDAPYERESIEVVEVRRYLLNQASLTRSV